MFGFLKVHAPAKCFAFCTTATKGENVWTSDVLDQAWYSFPQTPPALLNCRIDHRRPDDGIVVIPWRLKMMTSHMLFQSKIPKNFLSHLRLAKSTWTILLVQPVCSFPPPASPSLWPIRYRQRPYKWVFHILFTQSKEYGSLLMIT